MKRREFFKKVYRGALVAGYVRAFGVFAVVSGSEFPWTVVKSPPIVAPEGHDIAALIQRAIESRSQEMAANIQRTNALFRKLERIG